MQDSIGVRRVLLPELTSLRFFAALSVVIYHLQAMGIVKEGPDAYRKLAGIGYAGVGFFFVLSGFILVYTYAGRDVAPKTFWRARFARIYPAYAFSLLVAAPTFFGYVDKVPLFAWAAKHLKLDCFLVISSLQAWYPLAGLTWSPVAWSLSVEAFFYLLFPALLLFIAKRPARQLGIVILGCWLVSFATGLLYIWLKPDGIPWATDNDDTAFWLAGLKFNPLVRLPEFLAGMSGGLLFVNRKRFNIQPAILILPALIVICAVTWFQRELPYPVIHNGLLTPAFIALIYGFALQPAWSSVLRHRILVLFGDASYSMYLLHGSVIVMFFFLGRAFNMPLPLALVVYFLLTLTLSLTVYKFIEEPARRFLKPKKSAVSIDPGPIGAAASSQA